MNCFPAVFLIAALFLSGNAFAAATPADPLAKYDVVWDTPSAGPSGSMPIGNGDIGLNTWVEENGDLLFYISKTDSWSGNCQLLKLGRLRVSLTPNPFAQGEPFHQRLNLRGGEMEVKAGAAGRAVTIHLWVDANHPVVRVEASGEAPFTLRASYETWRTERRALEGIERIAAYGLVDDKKRPIYVDADHIVDAASDRVTWYYRNDESCYPSNLQLQGLGSLLAKFPDPLLNRTFGGSMLGAGFQKVGNRTLVSKEPVRSQALDIYLLTAQTATVDEWLGRLDASVSAGTKIPLAQARTAHRAWWNAFWNRSWIRASGTPDAEAVSRGYALQSWITACGGRGAYPIKFNGSIFTVDAKYDTCRFDADFRAWGGPFWFQNTRLPYWTMLASGSYDMMQPLFRMYRDILPLSKERTRLWYGHSGVFFPETIYFWGTHVNDNYGYNRAGMPDGLTENRYIRYHWESGIELVQMMLDYYDYTGDSAFLTKTLMPIAGEITDFYDRHYKHINGKIRFDPAQSLETWWDSVNPTPEIAGLHSILPRLLTLPISSIPPERISSWKRMLGELPPIPMRTVDGVRVIAGADSTGPKSNVESPELYTVFPFPIYGVGKDDLDMARRTYELRDPKDFMGWRQDAILAAMLGLTDEAERMVTAKFTTKHPESRFPAFWGPNYDWVPDQDHGSTAMIALQCMLMQADRKKIRLLPAWPADWNADFRLHAPYKTVVEGTVRNGKLERLIVTPPSRKKDVIVMSR